MARQIPPRAPHLLAALLLVTALAPPPLAERTSSVAWADQLTVDDGAGGTDVLTGELVRLGDDTVWFQPAWTVEPIEVPRDAVVSLTTDDPDTVVIAPPEPPAPSSPPVEWSGSASAGLSITDGNTDTQSLYAEGELVARTPNHRTTLGLQARQAETDGETTAENARASVEVDRFLTERWYLAATALGSRDEFQDIELRASLSLSSGYQVLDTEPTALAVELGASYVDVNYFDRRSAMDESYPAGRWSLDLRHELSPERVTFFHQQEGFQSLDDGEDLFVRSKTGFRFSLFGGFIATTQVNLDYDGDPTPGRESTDASYLLNLGVEW